MLSAAKIGFSDVQDEQNPPFLARNIYFLAYVKYEVCGFSIQLRDVSV